MKIRKSNPYAAIFFTSWKSEDTVECEFIFSRKLVLNSFQPESFSFLVNKVNEQHIQAHEKSVCVKTTDRNIRAVLLNSIVYAEVSDHIVSIHLHNGEIVETFCTMKKFAEKLLVYPEFLMPHRSFIVNSSYISYISSNELSLKSDSVRIPIARGKSESVKAAYRNFYENF